MKITIMVDMHNSFFHDYISELIKNLRGKGHEVVFCSNADNLSSGDYLFLLGCKTILSEKQLRFHSNNIVIHPSKLPEGKGSAALVWKILEGEKTIYITLFEANKKIDSGNIYFQEKIELEGHELSDEIRFKQAMKSFELILKFVDKYPNIKVKKQKGQSTYYPKRYPKDSELSIDKTIRQQFNLFRVVDNKRYPAFFTYNKHKYILKIYKNEKEILTQDGEKHENKHK